MVSIMLCPCMFLLPCQWICLFVFCVFDGVCELFGETILNMFGYVCYFVVEGDGSCVWLEVLYWLDHVWSSTECVCLVSV